MIPAPFDHVEYAIVLGDGTYDADEHGQVTTWTDRGEAERERDRIRCCGITVSAEGNVDRNPYFCNARLVQRHVTTWTECTQ